LRKEVRKMKKRIRLIIVMLAVSALITGNAFCETGACNWGKDKESYKEKKEAVTRQLNLTPEQDKLLKDAKAAGRAQTEATGKALKAKRQELQAALVKPGVTRQQLEPIASEIKALQSQMVDQKIDGILKIKGILTPEQYQKLQSIREERQKGGHMKNPEKRW